MAYANSHPEYRTWAEVKKRCYTPTYKRFSDYGGRGIAMSAEWKSSFWIFLDDMGAKPTPKHTIERIDNNGPYSKDNCRWATMREQNGNKRSNHWLTFNGERAHITEWARRTGLPRLCIRQRLLKLGWTIERALTERPYNAPEFGGEHVPLAQIAKAHGIKPSTLRERMRRNGVSVSVALKMGRK